MTPAPPTGTVAAVLLFIAVVVCTLSTLGLVVMRGFYNKLHYLAPPAIVATAAISAAVGIQEGWKSSTVKAGLVLLVMVIGNPVITFAAARANYLREEMLENPERPYEPEEATEDDPGPSKGRG